LLTIAEQLQSYGYATGGFVGNTHYCNAWTGLGQGFAHYEDFGFSWHDFLYSTALGRRLLYSPVLTNLGIYYSQPRKPAQEINASFLQWISRVEDRPFFAFLNYFDAHHPYLAPAPFDEHRPRTREEGRVFRDWWWLEKLEVGDDIVCQARKAYGDCVRHIDRQLDSLLDELERRGHLENTLVIVTSDHGEHFGEHGLFLHGNSLYQSVLHVPLFMSWPGHVPAGRRIAVPVSIQELPATIMDLALEGRENLFPGRSLARFWDPQIVAEDPPGGAVRSAIMNGSTCMPNGGRSPICRGPMKSVLLGGMKYIRNGDGDEELYDLRQDPGETNNLVGDTSYQTALLQCRKAILGP
jgi:arylsulfatase A-like enzyme